MSILIKGMEMPTSCQECPLKHRGFNGSETVHYCYAICKEVSDDGEIDADCPLVPVPPHGRLIDADALYREIKAECNPYRKPSIGYDDGLKVLGIIGSTPPVIPAEDGG